jgi:hypothetical protein
MKKSAIILALFLSCAPVFALKIVAADVAVNVYPGEPPLYYDFLSADLTSQGELILLGSAISNLIGPYGWGFYSLVTVIEDNTALSKDVKDKMRQLGANVCFTIYGETLIVNMLMPNRKYMFLAYGIARL